MGLVMPVTCRTHDFLIIPTKLCMGKKYFVVANLNQRELFFFESESKGTYIDTFSTFNQADFMEHNVTG